MAESSLDNVVVDQILRRNGALALVAGSDGQKSNSEQNELCGKVRRTRSDGPT